MKWSKEEPQRDDRRIVIKFLFWPKTLRTYSDNLQTRWLCTTEIEQRFADGMDDMGFWISEWIDWKWFREK